MCQQAINMSRKTFLPANIDQNNLQNNFTEQMNR